jgi:uncharacterized protein YjbJ (UPF0337 family)
MVTFSTDGGLAPRDEDVGRSEVAKQEAAQVTGTVQDQGAAVAGAVQDGAGRVVAETSTQVENLTEEAARQFREVLGRSQGEFHARAAEQADKASGQLKELAGELHALVEGRPADAPRAKGYVRQAAERVDGYAARLDSGGFAGVADDVGRFARRRPGTFLLGAVAAGFLAGRLARGAQAVSSDETPSPVTSARSGPVGESAGWVAPMPPPPPLAPPPLVSDPGLGDDPVAMTDPGVGGSRAADTEVLPPAYLAGGPEEIRGR